MRIKKACRKTTEAELLENIRQKKRLKKKISFDEDKPEEKPVGCESSGTKILPTKDDLKPEKTEEEVEEPQPLPKLPPPLTVVKEAAEEGSESSSSKAI